MAIVCPITLNDEIGQYEFTGRMEEGRFCFPLAQYPVEVELHLRKTVYSPLVEGNSAEEIVADFVTNPAKNKALELQTQADRGEMRKHAVCTVLTFKNKFTGTVFSLNSSCQHFNVVSRRDRIDAVHVHRILPVDGVEVSG